MWRRPLEMSLRLQKALQVLFVVVVVAVIVFAAVVVVAALVFRCCFCHSACSLLFFSSLATGRMRNMPALLHMRVCTSVCVFVCVRAVKMRSYFGAGIAIFRLMSALETTTNKGKATN